VSAGAGAPAADDARGSLDELLAATLVIVDGRERTGRDVLAAGVVSGEWVRIEQELSQGLGLVAAASPPDEEVDARLRDFRVERGLLSAEDLRAWMQKRGLALGAVKAVVARAAARERGGEAQPVTGADIAAALPAEVICTGALLNIGFWLADRMLSAATSGVDVDPIPLEDTRVQRLVFVETRTVAGAATAETGVERATRLGWVAALDEAHVEWEARVVGPRDIERRLREKELEWTRFELDELWLDSAGAAAEARRQLVEGAAPEDVAARAGVALATESVVLADAPPDQARALLGVVAGDVTEPWDAGEAHVVARVRERRAPESADEESVARASEELLAEAIARLRAGRVRWYDRI
jgi:hypothetical protein